MFFGFPPHTHTTPSPFPPRARGLTSERLFYGSTTLSRSSKRGEGGRVGVGVGKNRGMKQIKVGR